MQTRLRAPTTVLLAIIALLLAANLIINLPPQEAKAQTHLKTAAPHVIQVEPGQGRLVYRLWSDGVIEEARFDSLSSCLLDEPPTGFGWQVVPETVPLPHAVNITRIWVSFGNLVRLRSDGVVEQNWLYGGGPVWCGWRTPPE